MKKKRRTVEGHFQQKKAQCNPRQLSKMCTSRDQYVVPRGRTGTKPGYVFR